MPHIAPIITLYNSYSNLNNKRRLVVEFDEKVSLEISLESIDFITYPHSHWQAVSWQSYKRVLLEPDVLQSCPWPTDFSHREADLVSTRPNICSKNRTWLVKCTDFRPVATYSRFAPSQWEASLQSNAVSHWLGANLESALFITSCGMARVCFVMWVIGVTYNICNGIPLHLPCVYIGILTARYREVLKLGDSGWNVFNRYDLLLHCAGLTAAAHWTTDHLVVRSIPARSHTPVYGTRFDRDCQTFNRVIQEKYFFMINDIKFLNIEWRTRYSSQILNTILGCMSQLVFRPLYVWFLAHLYGGLIPNSSGQFAELIVYIIPLG